MPRTSAITLPELKLCKNSYCSSIATGFDGFCYSCDSRRNLRNYTSRPNPRASVKNPMGIEIECYNPESRNRVTHVAQYVCQDGSLPENGGEIKLCAPENKLEDIAADTVQRSRLVGNKVDSSCGLHVHMQIKELTARDWQYNYNKRKEVAQRVFELVASMQEFVFDIVPRSRRGNHYCGKIRQWEDLFDHHRWITFSSHIPTVEVRVHAGTMNPWKVKGWVNALKQIRPDIDKIVSGEQGWGTVVEKYSGDGFLTNQLKPNTIGYKYIAARNASGGTLRNFGFSNAG